MSVQIIKRLDTDKGMANGVEKAILETVIRVTAQAKALAPVDTGLLRASIAYKTGNKNGGGSSNLNVVASKNEGYVGTNTEYAIEQEYGTRNTKAQPYLRPAVDIVTKGTNYLTAVKKALDESLKQAVTKVEI